MSEKDKDLKKKAIFDRIDDFSKEDFASVITTIFWIYRIVNFIQNDLPDTEKYRNFVRLLNKLINEKGKLEIDFIYTKSTVKIILNDLKKSIALESYETFFIDFHPIVKEVSLDLFHDGHYSEAIFEAVKALNNYIKKKANITDSDLSNAMAKAFNEKNPILKLNFLNNQSDFDEQEGFRFLFQGAMKGIRNPRGHEIIKLKVKNEALEYLAFISLLFRKAENSIS